MKADNKQENLSWRGEVAYLRKKMPNGRETWKSLGKLSIDDARRIVRHMVEKMNAEDLQIKLGMIARRSTAATLGEVFAAYDKYTAGIQIEEQTVKGVKRCMSRILRGVHGENLHVESASCNLLTAQLIKDFSSVMIEARKAEGKAAGWDTERLELELGKAQRTIRSTAQQARSLFSAEARQSPQYRALDLPDLKEFLEVKVGESTLVSYDPPAADVLEKIRQEVPALKLADPAAWLAMMLEINGGLRRGSAVLAKWDWFVERGAEAVDLSIRVAKGGNSLVRFDWALYQEMKALRQDLGEFIVPGADEEARQAVFDRLLAWLRKHGMGDRRAPNHELRKWFGDEQFQQHGHTAAQNALGHSTPALTSTAYSQRRTQVSLRVL